MARVLLIGIKPEAVDLTDPDVPPGTTAEKIADGIEHAMKEMRDRGWQGGFCSILPDQTAEETIMASLTSEWDCIVIGGGIRIPKSQLQLFERVVNAVVQGAPGTPIAFNTDPANTTEAAARWVGRAGDPN